jgi:BirA family biotin operon repressor/biotin-[acetyl-CoA-carboxylase] ligase
MKSESVSPNSLNLEELSQTLAETGVGHTIIHRLALPSTMSLAHELARQPETRSGALVIADEQTAGRGRGERRWQAPAGAGFLASLILKGVDLPDNIALLSMLAGVAALQSICAIDPNLGAASGLKWPNDLLVGRAGPANARQAQKVGGILIENQFWANAAQPQLHYSIIGVGINLNQTAEQLPAVSADAPTPTSLALFLQRPIARSEFLLAFCRSWNDVLQRMQVEGAKTMQRQWRQALWTLGQPVTVYRNSEKWLQGTAIDVAEDGSLIVQDEQQVQHHILADDVSIRWSS